MWGPPNRSISVPRWVARCTIEWLRASFRCCAWSQDWPRRTTSIDISRKGNGSDCLKTGLLMLPQRKVSYSHSCIVKLVFLWEYYIFLNFLRHLDVISFFLISSYLVFLYRHILFSHTFIYFFYYTHTFFWNIFICRFPISSYIYVLYPHTILRLPSCIIFLYPHTFSSYSLIQFLSYSLIRFFLFPRLCLDTFSTYKIMLSFWRCYLKNSTTASSFTWGLKAWIELGMLK